MRAGSGVATLFGLLPPRVRRIRIHLPLAALAAHPSAIRPPARGVLELDHLLSVRPEYPTPAGEEQDGGGRPGRLAVVDADAHHPARLQPQGRADGAADVHAPAGI